MHRQPNHIRQPLLIGLEVFAGIHVAAQVVAGGQQQAFEPGESELGGGHESWRSLLDCDGPQASLRYRTPMASASKSPDQPLSDDEFARLAAFLASRKTTGSLRIEGLDGFLCALIVGPAFIMPSEYLPEIWGGEQLDEDAFSSQDEALDIMSMVMRYSNSIANAFENEGLYLPAALDLDGDTQRHDQLWAEGFMRGVDLRRPLWSPLILDENEGGSILTIALLAGEIDPEWRKRSWTADQQAEHLQLMCAGMVRMQRFFRVEHLVTARAERATTTVRREAPKVGRNQPCPCGSGRKFKHCCGVSGTQVH
ncbi:MAG: UPF0149 family protein [Steroidobacteraceae bacterium]